MNFVNNWSQGVTLAAGATSLSLSLPDGAYRLTLADDPGAATRWEIVDALVSGGVAELTRAVEGTVDQAWPSGSVMYCSITAGVLSGMQRATAHVYIYEAGTSQVDAITTAILEVDCYEDITIEIPTPSDDKVYAFDFSFTGNGSSQTLTITATGNEYATAKLNGFDGSKVGGSYTTDISVEISGLNGTIAGRALVTYDFVLLNIATQWQPLI